MCLWACLPSGAGGLVRNMGLYLQRAVKARRVWAGAVLDGLDGGWEWLESSHREKMRRVRAGRRNAQLRTGMTMSLCGGFPPKARVYIKLWGRH